MQVIAYVNEIAVTQTETYLEHCQTFKTERFAKRIMPECR